MTTSASLELPVHPNSSDAAVSQYFNRHAKGGIIERFQRLPPHRAAQISAFMEKYCDGRCVPEAGNRPIWREDGGLKPFVRAWLDENCPGWGILFITDLVSSDLGCIIGFAKIEHAEKFDVVISILEVRRAHCGRHDGWAATERFWRAYDATCFRSEFPRSRRISADKWQIWSSGLPMLEDVVVQWLDQMCPGWFHLSDTYYVGLPSEEHAVMFKMVWG